MEIAGLRLSALEKRVATLVESVESLTQNCVTRADLATMAGVEENVLDETKLTTRGGWRFLATSEEPGEPVTRVSFG